ncbi:hypothetical protein D9V86_04015 [Bacteroidetes/Chlorobi group bacterium ChocPot_Mid]|nr:MAG: hypothetical protein D9V86_04015 [Bacteroidetes/Chlorobi group bacterium ChocPot_Mid]
MLKSLIYSIYLKVIFLFITGFYLILSGIDIMTNVKVWNFFFSKINLMINKYGTESGSFLSLANKFFSVRFQPSDFMIGLILILIGCILIAIGVILAIPEKYFSTKFINYFRELNFKLDNNRKILATIIILILLSSIFYLFIDFNEHIARINSFKQADVAGNIHFYVEDGITLEEKMFNKNINLKISNYPFYQWVCAVIVKISGLDIEQSGRLFNIIIFVLTFILFYNLLNYLKVDKLNIILILLLFSFSPLGLYYYRSVHPDPLSIFFTFSSILLYIKYDTEDKLINLILSIITGIIACLIKNPIFLMGFIAIAFYKIYNSRSILTLFKIDFLIFSTFIFLSIVLYKFSTEAINGGISLPSNWIFGTTMQRMQLTPYLLLILWNAFEITNPLFFIISFLGFGYSIIKIKTSKSHLLFIGLLIGMLITIFIFFNVFQAHDYYHLPFIIIISYFTVMGFSVILNKIKTWNNIRSSIVIYFTVILFILTDFLGLALLKMPTAPDYKITNAGEYIQKNIGKNDFLFYTNSYDIESWDPTYLFHSRRNGYNISVKNIMKDEYIDKIVENYKSTYQNFYLYIPKEFLLNDLLLYNKFTNYKIFKLGRILKITLAQNKNKKNKD